MSDFQINGKSVDLNDWEEFKTCLALGKKGQAEIETVSADNVIDENEILGLLDANGDKTIDCWDFEGVNCTPLYYDCRQILEKYGFNIDKYSNKEFMLAAVSENPSLFELADESLKKDKDIVFAAAAKFAWAFQWADKALRSDKEFVIALVRENPEAFQYANKSLKTDIDLLTMVAQQDIRILFGITPQWWNDLVAETSENEEVFSTKALWSALVEKHKDELLQFFTQKDLKSLKNFRKALSNKYDIDFPQRFRSIDTILEVIKNRSEPYDPSDNRPVAVLIFAQEEWGKHEMESVGPSLSKKAPFEQFPLVDRMRYLGYRVMYYEARKQSDVTKYLKKSTDNGSHPADFIALAGHGTPDSLKLSSIVYWSLDGWIINDGGPVLSDSSFIDTGDFSPDEINLAHYIKPDGDLLLYACSNGAGGKDNPSNLANTVAKTLPQGVTIHTLLGSGNISDVYIEDGDLEVNWGHDNGYQTNGSMTK